MAPFGVTSVKVTLLGGGGGGGVQSQLTGLKGNGGGGAGYSQYTISVTPFAFYPYAVGCGAVNCSFIGCDGYSGGSTWFGTSSPNAYTAHGGGGGSGGDNAWVGGGGIGFTANGLPGLWRGVSEGGFGGACGISSPTFSCDGGTIVAAPKWGGGGAGKPNGYLNGGDGFLTLSW